MKLLIVVDMQNDFITGSLGTSEAKAILKNVRDKIRYYEENNGCVIFTQDTHYGNYLRTYEGIRLPIIHCISNTDGWKIEPTLNTKHHATLTKETFGSGEWKYHELDKYESIELIGVCTDICVVSNALVIKTLYPNTDIIVDASCCAGTTPENHMAALAVMKSCQIDIIGE